MTTAISRRTLLAGSVAGIVTASLADLRSAAAFASTKDVAIRHRRIRVNGVHLHIAEAGSGPAVLFLHGVPELWYSWRHQLPALAAAGFHAIAPDLRGCGESDAPRAIESYSMRSMTRDVVGILDYFGVDRAIIAGHDWGASIAWACAELHSRRVRGVIALSVPYHPRPPVAPTHGIAAFAKGRFNFVTYFQQPGVADAELGKDPYDSLRRFFYAFSNDAPPQTIPYLFTQKPSNAGVLDGMPEPARLPAWLSESDLEYYAAQYKRTGFTGILNLYRNMDRDWKDLPQIGTTGVKQPALFIGGKRDSAVMFGTFDPMIHSAQNLRDILFLRDCGHWTQQEQPEKVNRAMLSFLKEQYV